ncbi:hypothetical protein ACHAXM_005134 [Skeletonema potamos]
MLEMPSLRSNPRRRSLVSDVMFPITSIIVSNSSMFPSKEAILECSPSSSSSFGAPESSICSAFRLGRFANC